MTYVAPRFDRRDNALYPVDSGAVNVVQSAVETLGDQMVLANTALAQPAQQTVAYAATINVNAAAGSLVNVGALTGNVTFGAPTNPTAGARLVFVIPQDGTGSRTITWNAAFHFTGGSAFTPTATASKIDVVGFIYDGVATCWRETFRSLNQA